METNNISVIISSNYIIPCVVTLQSLYSTKKTNSKYSINIILIESDTSNDKTQLTKFNKEDFKINITTIEKDPNLSLFEQAMFLKLNLDKLLPNVSKTLFLDIDIIVNKDLSELYNTDITGKYLGAVRDIYPVILYERTHKTYNKNYFNVGVMLLNLDLIRQDKKFELARNKFKDYLKFNFPEQDLLNDLIKDKFKILHPKYNWIISNTYYTKKQLNNFYGIDKNEINDNDISIFHYAGFKPWNTIGIPYSKYWDKYFNMTLKKDIKLKKTINKNTLLSNFKFAIEQYRIFTNKELYSSVGLIK